MAPPQPATTYYCSVQDVADFLRINIDATSYPNAVQVAKLINRKEDEIDRRTGHAWRTVQVTELYDLPLLWNMSKGVPIFLHHRKCKSLDASSGDSIAIWDGSTFNPVSFTNNSDYQGGFNFDTIKGTISIPGYLFTVIRSDRVKLTYRFGETTVPGDIADACIKMVCIDLLTTSFKMDKLGVGTEFGLDWESVIQTWRDDIERTIWDRTEPTTVTN